MDTVTILKIPDFSRFLPPKTKVEIQIFGRNPNFWAYLESYSVTSRRVE